MSCWQMVTGVTAGNEEFQQAIRRNVPDGHTFKGYPVQFVHRNARRAFYGCLRLVSVFVGVIGHLFPPSQLCGLPLTRETTVHS